jgi:hypothetical protein
MLLVREIMYCKPGKVRSLVEKFLEMDKLGRQAGMPGMKIMTDFCAERFWTVVAEIEVNSIDEFEKMMGPGSMSSEAMKKMEKIMEGYHDLVMKGRREIYKLE